MTHYNIVGDTVVINIDTQQHSTPQQVMLPEVRAAGYSIRYTAPQHINPYWYSAGSKPVQRIVQVHSNALATIYKAYTAAKMWHYEVTMSELSNLPSPLHYDLTQQGLCNIIPSFQSVWVSTGQHLTSDWNMRLIAGLSIPGIIAFTTHSLLGLPLYEEDPNGICYRPDTPLWHYCNAQGFAIRRYLLKGWLECGTLPAPQHIALLLRYAVARCIRHAGATPL